MIYHTVNDTTTTVGQATATVIECSKPNYYDGIKPLYTLELVYPRYIHSEFMTHRMFSRNASSSRATPITVNCSEVINDPVFFDAVNANKTGMQGGEPLGEEELEEFHRDWNRLAHLVAQEVSYWNKHYNIHKQVLNRALEPFLRIRTLVTATEWDNFFKLRLDPAAQPEIQSLAKAMKEAMSKASPKDSDQHVPYVDMHKDVKFLMDTTHVDTIGDVYNYVLISAARCARVSYARLDGKPTDYDADIKLGSRILAAHHMSPFEHQCTTGLPYCMYANLLGWCSSRYTLERYM